MKNENSTQPVVKAETQNQIQTPIKSYSSFRTIRQAEIKKQEKIVRVNPEEGD
jgi:hypothetical protein